MEIILMNSRSSRTSDPHRQLLNLSNKIDLKGSDRSVVLSNEEFELCIGHILYQIFKVTLNISWKNMDKKLIIFQ